MRKEPKFLDLWASAGLDTEPADRSRVLCWNLSMGHVLRHPKSGQKGVNGFDYTRKQDFHWLSVIRMPDSVIKAGFDCAIAKTTKKNKQDFSFMEFLSIEEDLCGHFGSF